MKITTLSLVASCLIATQILANDDLSSIYVTSATKSKQSIKDVTSNVNVITKEEIEEKKFNTVPEALNSLPGINITTNGGLGKTTSVFMRGFDSQRILVLIDGIRYNDFTGISGARFEHLMISDIEQIEVIKGAQSGIWGADANAGVINIITSTAKKGTYSDINIESGSFKTHKLNAKVSHKTEIYDINLGITKINSDGFSAVSPKGSDIDKFEDDGYKNTTINFKTGYNLDDINRIEFIHNRINATTEYDYGFGSTIDKANAKGYELETNDSFSSLNFLTQQKTADIKLYTNYTRIDRNDDKGYTKEFDGTLKEYGLNTKIPYLKDSFILTGIDYKDTNHKNDVNKTLINKAAFITNSTKFNKFIFTQSLRYDKYDLFDNKTTGKIGVKYNFLDDTYFSTNYGEAYNVPTFYKLYDGFAGYSKLQPETTNSLDFTLGFKSIAITYFQNEIENMIEYNSSTYQYYNMDGKVKMKGVEIAYTKDIMDDLMLSMSYTYTDTEDDNGKKLQRRAQDSMKFSFDYYGIKNLHMNINGEYVGDRVEYDFGTYNQKASTGNYTLWNSVINYKFNTTTAGYLKIDNIFDKYYQTVDTYSSAPRSFYVGMKVNF